MNFIISNNVFMASGSPDFSFLFWFFLYDKVRSSLLKGYCTSYQKIACFVLDLKIINTFLKNSINIFE